MNDILATILGVLGFMLLAFSYIWYIKTIRNYPERDENIPMIAFREMNKKG